MNDTDKINVKKLTARSRIECDRSERNWRVHARARSLIVKFMNEIARYYRIQLHTSLQN